MTSPDTTIERPKLSDWLWRRGMKPRHLAERLGISAQSARRYCLPFGHADRRIPSEEALEAIFAWTKGEVSAADFYPPHLRPRVEPQQPDASPVRPAEDVQ